MSTEMAKIVFTPSGKRGEFAIGTSVLDAARKLGVDVDSVCGGRAICGRCQVECMSGDFTKHGICSVEQHLTEKQASEQFYGQRKNKALAESRRLSCQAKILGDVVIDVPASSQVHRQLVRKAANQRNMTINPAVHLHYVRVTEADMHDPSGDFQRLVNALADEWELKDLTADLAVLQQLQKALRQGGWRVTVAVHNAERIVAVWPGYKSRALGVAIDIGSTTVAAHLVDLVNGEILASDGHMNPQIRFGEDLMSRVSYVMMHPEGAGQMTEAVRSGINELLQQLVDAVDDVVATDIIELTLVGNPIMHHLVLGIDPIELGGAPFALATDAAMTLAARELDFEVNTGARVYLLPCIAGHVGADAAAVVLSEAPQVADELTLLVDLGTNAEIVLGHKRRLLACSSPTGPAFEGAQISCGQRAAPGAIERVRIDPVTLEPRFQVIGSELWSDDPKFAKATQRTGVTGVCGSGIIEVIAEMYLAGVITEEGVIDGGLVSTNKRIVADERTFSYVLWEGEPDLRITQNDVRQIQLAKAALHAGVTLLQQYFPEEAIRKIRLAGAFGSHIDVKHAMVLGLIPDCPLSGVSSAGNAAGTGALMALLDREARTLIEQTVGSIEKIETAIEPKFQEFFVNAMAIPHKTDPYTELFSEIQRPTRKGLQPSAEKSGRRRRRRKVT